MFRDSKWISFAFIALVLATIFASLIYILSSTGIAEAALNNIATPTAGVTEAKITSVTPLEIYNDEDTEVTIEGGGLSTTITIFIGQNEISKDKINFISDNKIIFTIPPGFPQGDYYLSILGGIGITKYDKSPITIYQYEKPKIQSVEPLEIYNNEEREISITGESLQDIDKITLVDKATQVKTELDFTLLSNSAISATIPVNFKSGTYILTFAFMRGDTISYEQEISVYDPIRAEILEVTPTRFVSNIEARIVISGTNLEKVNKAGLIGENITYESLEFFVDDATPNNRITVTIPKNKVDDNNASKDEQYQILLEFPDGTTQKTDNLTIFRPVIPMGGEFIKLAILLVILMAAYGWYYSRLFKSKSFQEAKNNKTMPGLGPFIGVIIGHLLIAFVIGLLFYLIWSIPSLTSLTNGQLRYLCVWLLAGCIIGMAWGFSRWGGYFYEDWPGIFRTVVALSFTVFALIAPFIVNLVNNGQWIEWAVWIELAILGIVIVVGGTQYVLIRRALAEEVKRGPSDEVIRNRIIDQIYKKGAVVTNEDLVDVPLDRAKVQIEQFYAENREHLGLNILELDSGITLSFDRRDEVREFSFAMDELLKCVVALNSSAVRESREMQELTRVIKQQIRCTAGKPFNVKLEPVFNVISLYSAELESVLPTPFPLIVHLSASRITQEQLQLIREIQNNLRLPSRFAIFFALSEALGTREDIENALKKGANRENIVVLGRDDWLKILTSRGDIRQTFMSAIQSQVDLKIFSPYQTKGPTKADMFYGRSNEINTITEAIAEQSVAVLGARRIGKTSMLQAVYRILLERNYLLYYMDCYYINSYESFFTNIIDDRQWHSLTSVDVPRDLNIDKFSSFVGGLRENHGESRIVFQFDEIDRLLHFDTSPGNDERMFRMFRALAQKKICQFIFSGERTILDKLADPSSSFYNFAAPIPLGLLDKETSDKLIQEPMNLIGISFEEPTITDEIYRASAGHPNLIQKICTDLLDQLNKTKTRIITTKMVNLYINSPIFRDEYVKVFWSQSNALEKAMSVIVCKLGMADEQDFLQNLLKSKYDVTITQIKRGIQYLTLSQLFTINDHKYVLKPVHFAEFMLTGSLSLDDWLDTFRIEWLEETSRGEA